MVGGQLLSVLSLIWTIFKGLRYPAGLVVDVDRFQRLGFLAIWAPLFRQLFLLKRNHQKSNLEEIKRDGVSHEQVGDKYSTFASILASVVVHGPLRTLYGKRCPAPASLVKSVAIGLPLSARFFGAVAFGKGHQLTKGFVQTLYGLCHLQKLFGTFASSMLMESRLVQKRRNLWCAMGAHAAFNCAVVSIAFILKMMK